MTHGWFLSRRIIVVKRRSCTARFAVVHTLQLEFLTQFQLSTNTPQSYGGRLVDNGDTAAIALEISLLVVGIVTGTETIAVHPLERVHVLDHCRQVEAATADLIHFATPRKELHKLSPPHPHACRSRGSRTADR